MSTLTEGKYPGEFVYSMANGTRSLDRLTLASGNNLGVGRVVAKITASGKMTDVDPAGNDGSETAAGILWEATDASDADTEATFLVRDAEVNEADLDFGSLNSGQKTTAKADLAAVGILVRAAA